MNTTETPRQPKTSGRVLVVDDERNITTVIEAMLERDGMEVLTCNQSRAAAQLLIDEDFDAVVTDLYMPELTGLDLLERCRQTDSSLPVVVITAHGTVEAAVTALKKGAFDFITKPFDRQELLNVVRKAVRTRRRGEAEPVAGADASALIGSSPAMNEVLRLIAKVAPSPSTVLIHGESGTGKELVAGEIHSRSPRANKPFIKINCAAIPATLFESELFGHEKGAFTGAIQSRPGRFELAHEGTLFLDEIGEMPLEMQVKLLRVLQEQEFERVGGVARIRVDVRIIAASNRNLEEEVRQGRFREDLFYRLNVVPIHLPPLRERPTDLELLIPAFLKQFNRKLGKTLEGVDPLVLEALRAHPWPGNIRQLENTLERMVLMSEGRTLSVRDLPDELLQSAGLELPTEVPDDEAGTLKDIVRRRTQKLERELIEKALSDTGGNVTRAAEKLGLSRKGLQLKMKELGIRRSEEP